MIGKSGYATMPGAKDFDSDVARSCAELLANPPEAQGLSIYAHAADAPALVLECGPAPQREPHHGGIKRAAETMNKKDDRTFATVYDRAASKTNAAVTILSLIAVDLDEYRLPMCRPTRDIYKKRAPIKVRHRALLDHRFA